VLHLFVLIVHGYSSGDGDRTRGSASNVSTWTARLKGCDQQPSTAIQAGIGGSHRDEAISQVPPRRVGGGGIVARAGIVTSTTIATIISTTALTPAP